MVIGVPDLLRGVGEEHLRHGAADLGSGVKAGSRVEAEAEELGGRQVLSNRIGHRIPEGRKCCIEGLHEVELVRVAKDEVVVALVEEVGSNTRAPDEVPGGRGHEGMDIGRVGAAGLQATGGGVTEAVAGPAFDGYAAC